MSDQAVNPPIESDLPPALNEQALLDLVSTGQRALGQGRGQEALEQANSILADSPDFVPALALKGDALERLGDVPAALACYEKVLELKPDSALDRIRATHLKRLVAMDDLEVEEAGSPARALMAAGAAALLFTLVAVGVFMVTPGRTSPSQDSSLVAQNAAQSDLTTFEGVAPVPTVGDGGSAPNPSTSVPPSAPDPVNQANPAARSENLVSDQPGYVPPPRRSAGSRPVTPQQNEGGNISPVNPLPNGVGPINVQPIPNTAVTNPGVPTAPPATAVDSRADAPEELAPAKKENPGVIDIRPSNPEPNRINGGSADVSDEEDAKNSAAALIRVARDAFVKGDIARAADAYEKALRMGASRGSTNQRLAQCYQRLGRKADAIAAYERAIAAYQSQLASGGDNSRISAALESCQQALKLLR